MNVNMLSNTSIDSETALSRSTYETPEEFSQLLYCSMMNPYQPVASVEPEAAAPKTSPASESVFRPLSWWARSAFILAGILIPITCHLLSLSGPPMAPLWQTGELGDKLSFILSPQAGFIFYPLIIWNLSVRSVSNCGLCERQLFFLKKFNSKDDDK